MKNILFASFLFFSALVAKGHAANLASDELQVKNQSGYAVIIECSYNKVDWEKKTLNDQYGIDIVTKDNLFYVKICQTPKNSNEPECSIYDLKPLTRYVIKLDENGLFTVYYANK